MTNNAEWSSVLGLTGQSHSSYILPACQSLEEPVEFRGIGRHGDRAGLTDHFLARITEDTLGRDVPDPHAASGIEENDRKRRLVDDRAQGLGRTAQLFHRSAKLFRLRFDLLFQLRIQGL